MQSGADGSDAVTHVEFSASGEALFVASGGKHVVEWDVRDATVRRQLKGDKHGLSCLALDATSNRVAVARTGIRTIDLSSGRRQHKLAGHTTPITHLRFAAEGVSYTLLPRTVCAQEVRAAHGVCSLATRVCWLTVHHRSTITHDLAACAPVHVR